jgi:hypothetical protein
MLAIMAAMPDNFRPVRHRKDKEATPSLGTLMNYILTRLVDSFALNLGAQSNVNRYFEFMSTLDHDTWLSRGVPSIIAGSEWPQIKADIDAGRPSPIGLVGGVWVWPTNDAAKITMLGHCHCVLAYGYDLDDASNVTLLVYDPNDPGDDASTIEMNIGNPTYTTPISTPNITAHIAGNTTFRAFFKHQFYSPVTPPAGISPGSVPPGLRGWSQLGDGQFNSGPAVASMVPNRLDVFARGTDDRVYTTSWTGESWSAWHQLAPEQVNSDPAAVSWGPGRIDVFARGTDNQIYQIYKISWTAASGRGGANSGTGSSARVPLSHR